jgi:hypothetical protein
MGCSSGELKNRNSITNGIRGPALFKAQPENILQLILAFLQGRGGKRRVRDRQLFLIFFSFLCSKVFGKTNKNPMVMKSSWLKPLKKNSLGIVTLLTIRHNIL